MRQEVMAYRVRWARRVYGARLVSRVLLEVRARRVYGARLVPRVLLEVRARRVCGVRREVRVRRV